MCFRRGIGCELDREKAKQNFKIAFDLGHANAGEFFAFLLNDSDPLKWEILSASKNFRIDRTAYLEQVELFECGAGNTAVIFQIGRILHKTVGEMNHDNSKIIQANAIAVSFYNQQIYGAKNAVLAWSQVAMRLRLIKDLRIHIAKLVWEKRREGKY